MKKILLPVVLSLLLAGCQQPIDADVVTTMFPQYDIVNHLSNDLIKVHSILPPGVEAHDFEPSSRDVVMIKNAKLTIYTSPTLDSWMNESSFDQSKLMNLASFINLDLFDFPENFNIDDALVHFWTDPLLFIQLIEAIKEKLIQIAPQFENEFTINSAAYISEILAIYNQFNDYLTNNNFLNETIYFAGHDAFSLFGLSHHLQIETLFSDFKPDDDLTSLQLINFTKTIKDNGVHYLFIEEMNEPKAALTIKNELAKQNYELHLLELHAYHNVSKDDHNNKVTYKDLYMRNISNIKEALINNND